MRPIAIFRHLAIEGPGLLAEILQRAERPWQLIAVDQGDPIPRSADGYAGLVFMGGPMSVNDELPWIDHSLNLIRHAMERGIPVLGHCLGGQLMAKALGGQVGPNPVKEIGWGEVQQTQHPDAAYWFGDQVRFPAFHWHGETFSLPPGSRLLLSSEHCAHQAFAIGPHLALQCHVEMTRPMIQDWCQAGAGEIATSQDSPGVQSPQAILAGCDAYLPVMNQVAMHLYGRWLEAVKRD